MSFGSNWVLFRSTGPIVALCIILATMEARAQSPYAVGACMGAPTALISPAILDKIRQRFVSVMAGQPYNASPVPLRLRKEDASIQAMVRASHLRPPLGDHQPPQADIIFGNEYVSDIEHFVLPSDQRLLCLLLPGTGVFLSDGITHHVATVETVDRNRNVVRLLDPWARQSFLRFGANVLGVRGIVVDGEPPRIELPFADAVRVIKGLVSIASSQLIAESVAVLYPTEARQPMFFVWKYSRIVGGSNFSERSLARLKIRQETMSGDMADLLDNMLRDLTVGLPRNSGSPASQDVSTARIAFERRLRVYAVRLPWIVSWQMARMQLAVGSPDDSQRVLAILAQARPDDIDLQILPLAYRLRVERVPVPEADLDRLELLWRKAVYDNIAGENEEDAVRYFRNFEYPGGTPMLSVNWTRRARIDLLRWTSALIRAEPMGVSAQFDVLSRAYPGQLTTEFFSELLDFFDMADGAQGVVDLVELSFANKAADERRDLAEQLERFVVTRRSVASLTRVSSAAVRALIIDVLCASKQAPQAEVKVNYPGERRELREDLGALCAAAAPQPLAAPTATPTVPALPGSGPGPQSLVVAYEARLGPRDRVNSNGVLLRSVAEVIRQDRANFHRFRIRDPDDQSDVFFSTSGNRALVEDFMAHPGSVVALTFGALDANPLVRIEVWRGPEGHTIRVLPR